MPADKECRLRIRRKRRRGQASRNESRLRIIKREGNKGVCQQTRGAD
jgi:hypothetical protein